MLHRKSIDVIVEIDQFLWVVRYFDERIYRYRLTNFGGFHGIKYKKVVDVTYNERRSGLHSKSEKLNKFKYLSLDTSVLKYL